MEAKNTEIAMEVALKLSQRKEWEKNERNIDGRIGIADRKRSKRKVRERERERGGWKEKRQWKRKSWSTDLTIVMPRK